MTAERFAPDTFPVISSLLSPAALADAVAAAYGLADVRCRLIKATIRDVYRVEASDGPRVLIVYRHDSRRHAEILAELDLLEYLAAHGVSVAPCVTTLDGQRIVPLPAPEGLRYAVLFQFAAGAAMQRTLEPAIAHRYGQLVAQVHAVADRWTQTPAYRPIRAPLDATLLVDRPLALVERLLTPSPAELADLMRAGQTMRRSLVALPQQLPGFGLIHGDVIPTNLVVGPGDALTLLDFDFCGPGWRAFDIATFLRDAREQRMTDGSDSAFLAGYQEVRPLLDWEQAALPLFAAIRSLFRLGNWGPRLEAWGTSTRPDDLVAGHLAAIQTDLARLH